MVWDYTYDSQNNLTTEKLSIDGRAYQAKYTYNSIGAMTTRVSPSGRSVTYSPNGLGQSTRVVRTTSYDPFATEISYHVNGAVESFYYGNGIAFSLEQNSRQLPSRLSATIGAVKAMDLGYTYDKAGNTTTISDYAVGGENRYMTYDGLGRLEGVSGPWGAGSFVYDALGNIRSKRLGSRVVSMNYNSLNRLSSYKDTANGNSWRTVQYDSKGNITDNYSGSSSGLKFVYDLANQPISISKSDTGSFVYDGNFKRVKQTSNGKSIYSFYSRTGQLYFRDDSSNAANKKDYYYVGGKPVLVIKGAGGTYKEEYLHSDVLGSPVASTNNSRNVIWRESYTPFGEKRKNSQGRDEVGFTGHVNDSSGLIYMQARYYDPVIGRFYSNDPVGALGHMQRGNSIAHGFNRYAYANNNPYKYTDPDGKFILKALTIGADIVDFASDVAAGNYASAAVTAAGIIDPTGILSTARRGVKAQKVYRALSKNDNIEEGLTARNPSANATPAQHVNGKKDSQFISTTKDKSIALEKYNSGNGVVEIDMSKVNGNVTDVSGGIPGGSVKVNNFAKKDQEVLVEGRIPPEAMKRID